MRTIYFDQTGPLIKAEAGTIEIYDLNPEHEMCWRVSRWEMMKMGWRLILAAAFPS